MRRLEGTVVLKSGVHRRGKDSRGQQRPFDRIRRAPLAEMRLNCMGEGLEQVPVLPWPDMETCRQRLRFARNATTEMPFDARAAFDGQHDGPQPVQVMDQDG